MTTVTGSVGSNLTSTLAIAASGRAVWAETLIARLVAGLAKAGLAVPARVSARVVS